MKWFVTKLVYRINNNSGKAQFEEKIVLVNGWTEAAAFQKANREGIAGESYSSGPGGKQVHWQFLGVTELYAIPSPCDGLEFFSNIVEENDPADYVEFVKRKSETIFQRAKEPASELN